MKKQKMLARIFRAPFMSQAGFAAVSFFAVELDKCGNLHSLRLCRQPIHCSGLIDSFCPISILNTMNSGFTDVFATLRKLLQKHAGTFSVKKDNQTCYSLEAPVGPATLQAWRGKMKRPAIPIAWVEIGKASVNYHLMGIAGNAKLVDGLSKELKARFQGKACFHFKSLDDSLLEELDSVTASAIAGFRKAGYVT